ncbi:MAG: beta-ketoacyl-ACP synthase II [Peptococcaceae bacterium]|jgi:3-oxoacyl-[acyl-carrier-protein] synthase II|nr:beta-ketoacyl-ACP synthase II [Peptococcaceae bacterium]
MGKQRVVITGMGAVTPLGTGLDLYWDGLLRGRSGVRRITHLDAEKYSSQIAGEVPDFNPEQYMDKKELRRTAKFTQFGLAAAEMAVKDADLDLDALDRDRCGVILGCGVGGIDATQDTCKIFEEKGPGRISPFFVPMMISNMVSGQTAIRFGFKGVNYTVVTACASGTNGVGEAFHRIQRGDVDLILTGGTEASITGVGLGGFCSMKALSLRNDQPERASRPFDRDRDGFVIGEGAGVLVLESLEHARRRGARIYAEVLGYGATCDAYHMTAPDPEGNGAARAMEMAIREAGLDPCDINYINAHGTSTDLNDKTETMAIKRVFGDYAYRVAISSTKSMTGHLLGAAGGIEAIAAAKSVQEDRVAPTINYENQDPECDLDYVPNHSRELRVNYAISNTFGFGGHNAVILLGKPGDRG